MSRSLRHPHVSPGEIQPLVRDMTVIAAADVALGQLQERLKEFGQWLPVDGSRSATIASLVAENSTGPLRLGYGAWRDVLLGVQFINGRDELITAGGQTVKNVAGYDLTKFIVGSQSVFGRLVTLTARTYRRPNGALLVKLSPRQSIVESILTTALRPQWTLMSADALWLGYLGDPAHLDFYRAKVEALEPLEVIDRTLDADIEHRAALWDVQGTPRFRASVPPAKIFEFVAAAKVNSWIADPVFGVVRGSLQSTDESRALTAAAAHVGGSAIIRQVEENAEPGAKIGGAPDLTTSPMERQILERLKHAFDPDNRLTPLPWHHT